jgi:hypothetical protein
MQTEKCTNCHAPLDTREYLGKVRVDFRHVFYLNSYFCDADCTDEWVRKTLEEVADGNRNRKMP